MVMYAKIRRMFFREHLSISEMARRTSLTRNTIKKWLKAADGSESKYHRLPKLTKLTPFEPKLLMALAADAHRPKRDRRTESGACAKQVELANMVAGVIARSYPKQIRNADGNWKQSLGNKIENIWDFK